MTPLKAQDLNSITSSIDEVRERRATLAAVQEEEPEVVAYAADGSAEQADVLSFDLVVGSSLTYDSNPARSDAGSRDSARFRQLLVGTLSANLSPVVLSVEAGIVNDEYSKNTDNDLTLVPITLKGAYGNQDTGLSPYLSYAPTMVFGDFLSAHLATVHDFGAGVVRRFDLDRNPAANDQWLALEANYTRRHATISELEEHRPYLKATYFRRLAPAFTFAFVPKLTRRMFTGGANKGRDDWNIEASANVEWRPRPEFRLQMTARFESNRSDAANADYKAWNIGPALNAVFSF